MLMDQIQESTSFIQEKILNHQNNLNSTSSPLNPKVGVILGSGLGDYVEQMTDKLILSFENIPHFLPTTVVGHSGALIFGFIQNTPVIALQGRIHPYEGHSMKDVVFPVRVMANLGIEHLIITNASGGINESFKPGDLVIITDHINLSGRNPLVGPNLNELGPRFPDMSQAYNPALIELLTKLSIQHNVPLKKGVYCSVLGPSYETPAEVRMLKVLGADLVGMSTTSEVIAAHHAGIKVVGVACVTNYAAGIKKEHLSHDDVKIVAEKAMVGFKTILTETIKSIYQMD